jgi:IS5 family transposase
MPISDAGHLTDAQARSLVVKALRQARAAYRTADTAGEKEERELDRLIKRKTRISANQLATLATRYNEYLKKCAACQLPLRNAFEIAANF